MTTVEVETPKLTHRHREILSLCSEGLTAQEIADRLFISPRTVHFHLRDIFDRLEVHNRIQAIRKAERLGLMEVTS